MPGTRITADERGRLRVPFDPIVPVVEGDGAGPVVWKASRPAIDRAVQKAYEGKRRIEWLEVLAGERGVRELNDPAPDATVNAFRLHRVGLRGALNTVPGSPRDLAAELEEILDLGVTVVPIRLPPGMPGRSKTAPLDLTLYCEAREDAAAGIDVRAGTPPMYDLVKWLEANAPKALSRLPFGVAETFDKYRQTKGYLPTGLVELSLNVRHASRLGTERIATAAIAAARKRLTFVRENGERNVVDDSFVEWAFQLAARNPTLAIRRFADRKPGPVPAVPDKQVLVDDLPLGELLEEILAAPQSFEVIAAASGAGDVLARTLLALVGGDAAGCQVRLNPLTGHAVFEERQSAVSRADADLASPIGMLRAGEQLLEYLGWREASLLLKRAIDDTCASGKLPGVVAQAIGAPVQDTVGCVAFGRTVVERLG